MFLVLFTFTLLFSPLVRSACTSGTCEPNCIQAAAVALNFNNSFPPSLVPQLFTVVSAGFNLGHPLMKNINPLNFVLFDCDMRANCVPMPLIEDSSTRLGELNLNVFYGMPPQGVNAGYRGFLVGRGTPGNLVWFNTPCAARQCTDSELSALLGVVQKLLSAIVGPGKPLGVIQFDASASQLGSASLRSVVISTFLKGGLVIGQIGDGGDARDPASGLVAIGVGSRVLPSREQKIDQARGPGTDEMSAFPKKIGPWSKPDVQGITNICTAVGTSGYDIFTTTSASSPMITSLAALYHTYLINNGVNAMLIPGYIASWLVAIGNNDFFYNDDLSDLNTYGAGLVRPPNFRDITFGKNFVLNYFPISLGSPAIFIPLFDITGCAIIHVAAWAFVDPAVISNNTNVPGPWRLDYRQLWLGVGRIYIHESSRPSETQKISYFLVNPPPNGPLTIFIEYTSVNPFGSAFQPEVYFTSYYTSVPCP